MEIDIEIIERVKIDCITKTSFIEPTKKKIKYYLANVVTYTDDLDKNFSINKKLYQ